MRGPADANFFVNVAVPLALVDRRVVVASAVKGVLDAYRLAARDGQPFVGGGVPRGELASEGDLGLGADGADDRYR